MSSATLENQTVHDRKGGVWAYISPSRLNLWLRCPLAFKLRYIEGVTTRTSSALFLGKQVHAALEAHYRHRQLGITLEPADVVGRVTDSWDEAVAAEDMQFDSTAAETKLKQQLADLVEAYLQQVPEDEPVPQAVEAKMEAPLVDPATGEDLGIPLLGVVDLITDDDGPLIVDFKTSSRSSPPYEVSNEIQLSSYAYLFRQLTGQQEAGLEIRSLVKTKTPKVECHRYPARSDQHFRRLFAVIREYLDALDSGRFNFRPGWGCAMCDHRDAHCQAWLG